VLDYKCQWYYNLIINRATKLTKQGKNKMNKTYGIMRKDNKQYFAGFSDDGSTIWAEKEKAYAMDLQHAKTQAALFLSSVNNIPIQRKPKVI
jgi:hypothetical protein